MKAYKWVGGYNDDGRRKIAADGVEWAKEHGECGKARGADE